MARPKTLDQTVENVRAVAGLIGARYTVGIKNASWQQAALWVPLGRGVLATRTISVIVYKMMVSMTKSVRCLVVSVLSEFGK